MYCVTAGGYGQLRAVRRRTSANRYHVVEQRHIRTDSGRQRRGNERSADDIRLPLLRLRHRDRSDGSALHLRFCWELRVDRLSVVGPFQVGDAVSSDLPQRCRHALSRYGLRSARRPVYPHVRMAAVVAPAGRAVPRQVCLSDGAGRGDRYHLPDDTRDGQPLRVCLLALSRRRTLFYTLRSASRCRRQPLRRRLQPAEIFRVQNRPRVAGSRRRRCLELVNSSAEPGRQCHIGQRGVARRTGSVAGPRPRLPSDLPELAVLSRAFSLSAHFAHVSQPATDRRAAPDAEEARAHARRRRPAFGRHRLGALRGRYDLEARTI